MPNKKASAQPQAARTPIEKINCFPVLASVWSNEGENGNPFYAVTFQRAYKDGDDKWAYSNNFSGSDLLLLEHAARLAFDAVTARRLADRETEQEPEPKPKKRRALDEDIPF